MLGVSNIPLTEVHYYHHERENPGMKCMSLFVLSETSYGVSVGCYDTSIAQSIMQQISATPKILSDTNRQKLCLLLQKTIRIAHVSYSRYFCTDTISFREVPPPEGYSIKQLSSGELANIPVNKDWITYGIIIDS
jgi:hypothetical protein